MPVGRHHGARGFASYVVFACAVVCGTDGGVVVIVLSGGPPWKLVSIESNRTSQNCRITAVCSHSRKLLFEPLPTMR
jgi:hypothetical protein